MRDDFLNNRFFGGIGGDVKPHFDGKRSAISDREKGQACRFGRKILESYQVDVIDLREMGTEILDRLAL